MPKLVMPADAGSTDTEKIWQTFSHRLLAFITHRVGSAADAEDILQDVFLRIHLHADSIKHSERLPAWLFQVTRNAIIDYYRAPVRREQPEAIVGPETLQQFGPVIQPPQDGLDAAEAREELAGCLQPMLGSLPPHVREAVTLVDLSGMSQTEAAARLGLSVSGMKSRVQRGRRALKATLVQCCPVQLDTGQRVIDYQRPASTCANCSGGDDGLATAHQSNHQERRCCSPPTGGPVQRRAPGPEPHPPG